MNLFDKLNWIGNFYQGLLLTWWMNFPAEDFCLTYSSSALDKRLTDLYAYINALSAFCPLCFTDLEECTSQLPLSSESAINYSLSKCHPESDAVAALCAWVKLSHLVAVVSVSLPEHMWHLTQAFFYGVQNRMSCCSLFSHLWHNQQWYSVRTFHGPQS